MPETFKASWLENWTWRISGADEPQQYVCLHSVFLGDIKTAFEHDPKLANLLLDSFFSEAVQRCQASWRVVVAAGATLGIPLPTFSTALAFYDGYRSERLPANLIQVCQWLDIFRFCSMQCLIADHNLLCNAFFICHSVCLEVVSPTQSCVCFRQVNVNWGLEQVPIAAVTSLSPGIPSQ